MPSEQNLPAPEEGPGTSDRMSLSGLPGQLGSPGYRRALAGAAPALLVAYGFAMTNFTLAGDDWFAVFAGSTMDTRYALTAGRWLMPLTWSFTGNGSFVPYFTFAVALALLVVAGAIACATWSFRRSWAVFAAITLFVVNPLFTDPLAFKQHHLSYPLGMVCAAAAGWVLLRWAGARIRRVLIAAGLLVLSLAAYQPTALVFGVVLVGWEVRQALARGRGYRREVGGRWLEALVTVVTAVGLYLLSVRIVWWAAAVDPLSVGPNYRLGAGYPSTPAEVAGALRDGFRMIGQFWFGPTTLYPLALKVVDLTLVGAGVLAVMGRASRAGGVSRGGSLGTRAWLLLLGAGSLLIPFSVLFVRESPPMRGGVFTTVGLVVGLWAGLLLERGRAEGRPRRRRLPEAAGVALVLVAVAGCAHQVNQGYVGLYLSNQRDLANVSRMLSVMEQMPEFNRGERVYVELVGLVRFAVGPEPFSNALPGPAGSIVNRSGLADQNRLVNMLNLIGGGERSFGRRSVSGDPAVAAVISTMPSWPEPGSIRYLERTFIIKGS